MAILPLLATAALLAWSSPQKAPSCRLTLIPATESFQPGKPFQIALKFDIEPKWHIYWLNPGDSGVPTEIKWTLPTGFKVERVEWSSPDRIDAAGVVSYGYSKTAYAVATIRTPAKAAIVAVKAAADWLICKDVCLEGKGSAAAALLPNQGKPLKPSPAFARAKASLPIERPALRFKAQVDAKSYRLEVRPSTHKQNAGGDTAYFYPFSEELADHSAKQSLRPLDGMFTLDIPRSRYEKGTARRLKGILKYGYAKRGLVAVVVDAPIS